MKSTLLFLLFFACLSAAAQPTLTQATNAPVIGKAYTGRSAHVAGVSYALTGAGVTWDYSNIADSAALDTSRFISPSATAYAGLFPTANLASADSSTATTGGITSSGYSYGYYLVNSSGVYVQGIFQKDSANGSLLAIDTSVYTPALNRYPLPMTYQNVFYESSQLVSKTTIANDTSIEKDTIMADGWGTLKLPGKTYSNVLRVVTHEDVLVNETIEGIVINSSSRSFFYSFYTPGYYNPLLTLNVDTLGNVLGVAYVLNNVLPLQLLSFTAAAQKTGVELNWSTTAEVNTHVFNIQRSTTGSNFMVIGQVPAQQGAGTNNYSFVDNQPPAGEPVLYYRLQEVDFDGNASYSKVQPVAMQAPQQLRMWPNPAGTQPLHVQGTSLQQLSIFDVAGHLLQSISLKGADTYELDMHTLAKGVYLVTVWDGLGHTATNKIVVQ